MKVLVSKFGMEKRCEQMIQKEFSKWSMIRGKSASVISYDDFAFYCPDGSIRTWEEETLQASVTTLLGRRRLAKEMVAPILWMFPIRPQGTIQVFKEELR